MKTQSRKPGLPLDRRSLLVSGTAAVTSFAIIGRSRAEDRPLVIGTSGGPAIEASKVVWGEPFTKMTGIPVEVINAPDLTKLQAQVRAGRLECDVMELAGSVAVAGARAGLFEEVDRAIVDEASLVLPSGSPYLTRFATYTGCVAWNEQRHPDGKHPRNFAEYFDPKGFPGTRTLRTRISETLEMALVGSGVPPEKLYPLDVERGFAALAAIRPHIRKWVSETPQMAGLLQSGEVDFTYAYNSRIGAARQAGHPLAMSLEQCIIGSSYLAVGKGSKRREAAMKLIAHAIAPETQAAFTKYIWATPNAKGALEKVPSDIRAMMPDPSNKAHVVVSDEYWADHFATLNARLTEWLLQ